uniref:Carboxylesterase type B domain-containing protein n=1 Tax=Acrobeloides nanus TaxID=290746 RepID=A0A914D8B2_9BILA
MSNTSHTRSPQKNINEDCLYVNIFADRRCNSKQPCPVIHYIHGGGYYYDSAVMFNETFIIEKYASEGVVFVVPAYRLGVFGFLDLGDDNLVPRNLGLHDIVYGIKWVRREIKRFGGDPKKITLMGNSVGASTILYLSVAPGVPKGLWSQVIISSGVNEMDTTIGNINITYQILDLAGCLHANRTKNSTQANRELTKRETVQCLRQVDAMDLLNYQRQLEDENEDAKFRGVSIDGPIFHGKGFYELLNRWKAVPSIIGSTKCEFSSNDSPMANVCAEYPKYFNYTSEAVFEACIAHYSNISDETLSFSADPIHAEVYQDARVITQRGGKAFVYSFDQENHTYHSNDVTFIMGIHLPENWTVEEKLMAKYFPEMIRRFVKTGQPDKDWKPMDNKTGKNYFVLDFSTYQETTFGPYLVEEPYYEEAAQFWLYDLAKVEAQAHQNNITPLVSKTLPFFSLRSIVLNETDEYNDIEQDLESLTDLENFSLIEKLDDEDESVNEAWGPFWVSLSLSVILAAIILVMVVSRVIYRFKNTKGYYYNDDPGFFTESTKIVTMNGPKYYS